MRVLVVEDDPKLLASIRQGLKELGFAVDGGQRLIEAPKSRLREIQRRLLHEILDKSFQFSWRRGALPCSGKPFGKLFDPAAAHDNLACSFRARRVQHCVNPEDSERENQKMQQGL